MMIQGCKMIMIIIFVEWFDDLRLKDDNNNG